MKQSVIILLLFAVFSFTFTACDSIEKSDAVAEQFYLHLENKEFSAIPNLVAKSALEDHPAQVWIDLLKAKQEYWGAFKSYKRTAFSTNTNDGQTTTSLDFTVEHENGTVYERMKLLEKDGEMRIYSYQYNEIKAELD